MGSGEYRSVSQSLTDTLHVKNFLKPSVQRKISTMTVESCSHLYGWHRIYTVPSLRMRVHANVILSVYATMICRKKIMKVVCQPFVSNRLQEDYTSSFSRFNTRSFISIQNIVYLSDNSVCFLFARNIIWLSTRELWRLRELDDYFN